MLFAVVSALILLAHPLAEPLDRALVAVPGESGMHVSWRLLPADAPDQGFNLYRLDAGGGRTRLNAAPIVQTSGLVDAQPGALAYILRSVAVDGAESADLDQCTPLAQPYLALPVASVDGVQKCGLGDLDGDGRLDYVFKLPNRNVDPYKTYWEKSTEPYWLQAVSATGRTLWTHDLGWSIERGIWYSPYLVYDLDRDGRAEVVLKAGEGDPRDADGRVQTGPEWLLILDGPTGAERTRVPWPDRTGFGEGEAGYNYASRNQLAVAWLDGARPSLIALRGTYTLMKAQAWDLHGAELRPRWTFESAEPGVRGQGAHTTACLDLDGDGRDEVLLGSVALDDDGTVLWATRQGHPDFMYLGDLHPARPGLEILYGIESRRDTNGVCLADARTGEIVWGLDEATQHVHGQGLCGDFDPANPGAEVYAQDADDHNPTGRRWLFAADGELLSREVDYGFAADTAYWDADLQREIIWRGGVTDFDSASTRAPLSGAVIAVADVLGDWREEIICSAPGEVRVYTTAEPAFDRRVTLLADPLYRASVAHLAMGYEQSPSHGANLEAGAVNVNVWAGAGGDPQAVVAVVAAPRDRPVHGLLTLNAAGLSIQPATVQLDLAAGERRVVAARLDQMRDGLVSATLRFDGRELTATAMAHGLPANGSYERVADGRPLLWSWWSRDGSGGVTTSDVAHDGQRSAALSFDGERDWAFTAAGRLKVQPADRLTLSGWARAETTSDLNLAIAGFDAAGQVVTWELAIDRTRAPHNWRKFTARVIVPAGVAEVVVRWVGRGPTRVWVDDVRLARD